MKNHIYYLTKPPFDEKQGLIFPSEIEDDNYYGVGNFFINSRPDEELINEYVIFAIHEEELIKVILKKSEENNNFYECFVNEVGYFVFFAEKLKKELKYVGQNNNFKNLQFQYRLRIWNTNSAERAVIVHQFYFVGASEDTNP